jgi:hypothetical protein
MASASSARRKLGRAKRTVQRDLRRVSAAVVDITRRGDRTVVMTPRVGLRLGNFLYVWLRAHQRSAAGWPTRALAAPGMTPWLTAIPEMRALTVDRSEMRYSDRREWDNTFLYQRFGVDFTADQVDTFAREALGPHMTPDSSGMLVVNVRRGDYYTDFREKYAFDQVGYIRAALEVAGPADHITVVSDDAEWCRANLADLLAGVARHVDFADPEPWANLRMIAGASRIIGTNSTFSYWGAHAATALQGARVIMPRFHGRMGPGRTDAHQLDPRWTAIEGYQ